MKKIFIFSSSEKLKGGNMEPNYWLCILNRENFESVKKNKVWGVSERHKNQIHRTKVGDKLAFYLISEVKGKERLEPAIGGIAEVASEVFVNKRKIFPSAKIEGEVYPYRIKIKNLEVFKPEKPFKPLIEKLNFITNKKKYSGHLIGRAMRAIPREDFELLVKSK